MAEEKKNPLIGAFRSPPPKEAAKAPPDAKVAESVKPSTADKPIPAAQKPAEPVKPVIPPKAEETKAAPKPNGTATPVKPTEEKPAAKPSVPAKAEDTKAAAKPPAPAKPEEAKPAAKPEEKKAEKPAPAAVTDTKPTKAEEKKPVAAPAEKKSEDKKPEETPPAKQEEKKADVPAKSEDKKPVEDKSVPKAETEKKEQPPEKETDAEGIPKDFKLNIVGEGALGSVVMLPVDKIDDFEGHPFPVQDDKDMLDLVESVRKFGVLEPVTVIRSSKDPDRYEMVAGHRRKHSCVLAGVAQIPAIVRDMDRDSAIIYMVDSNLKRENISPMVKARAYSMKLEAMKRKAGRPTKAQLEAG